jgi:hypothetical protein
MEIWKRIEWATNYEVSNTGKVRQLGRTFTRPNPRLITAQQTINIKPKEIFGWVRMQNNRPVCVLITIRANGQSYYRRVHQIVMEAFNGKCPAGLVCCHNDGNPLNNNLDNLRWDTVQGNLDDMIKHGTRVNPPIHYGASHPQVKFGEDVVDRIRSTKHWPRGSIKQLAQELGVNPLTISRIIKGQSWTRYGNKGREVQQSD